MVELRKDQKRMFFPYEDKYYCCIVNVDENGDMTLASYSKALYVKKQNDEFVLDGAKVVDEMKAIADYSIANMLNYLKHPYDYNTFVRGFIMQMQRLFNVQSAKEAYKGLPQDPKLEALLEDLTAVLEDKVKNEEKIFKEQIVPQIPANWPYAMFPESSWTTRDSDVKVFQVASGNTYVPAEKSGISLADIKAYSRENQDREMKVYNALNDQIQKLNTQKGIDIG